MAFCTKCGRKLEDGEVCTCTQQNSVNEQTFNPYENNGGADGPVSVDNKDVVINIDTDKVKKGISDAVGKISAGVDKGVTIFNEKQNDYNTSTAFEHGMKIVPDCIAANDGEVPIKQYDFAKLRSRLTFEKAQGRIQVTNKRVIFRAAGRSLFGKSVYHQEFSIDEIAGIEARCKPEFNILSLIIGLIITGIFGGGLGYALTGWWYARTIYEGGISPTAFSVIYAFVALAGCVLLEVLSSTGKLENKLYGLRQILLSIAAGSLLAEATMGKVQSMFSGSSGGGFATFCFAIMGIAVLINLFLYSITKNLVTVFKTGAAAAIEIRREPMMGLLSFIFTAHDEANSGYQEILPWTDTDLAIRELGTMIDDIKTMGDAAIEKWKA